MSVEEILKSIRKVIEKEDGSKVASNDEDVLELTELATGDMEPLLSKEAASETSDLLKGFADSASTAIKDGSAVKGQSVEDLVVEMMKPQLKNWLDENLPLIVKELVEKELRRLVPGRKEREN